MSAEKTSPPFPPAWIQNRFTKHLVRINSAEKCLNPTFLAHLLITIGIVSAALLLYYRARSYIAELSFKWQICPPMSRESESQTVDSPSSAPRSDSSITPEGFWPDLSQTLGSIDKLEGTIQASQKGRLKAQLIQIRAAQSSACAIGVYFFANRTAGQSVSTASAIVAISSLAFLSKKGWEGTNNAVINIGVTSGLVLFSTWTFGQLYGQSVNYENQRTKFVLTTNLLNSISSAVANRNISRFDVSEAVAGQDAEPSSRLNNSDNMAILIESVDKQLAVINDLKFEGDSSFAESSAKTIGDILNQSRPSKPVQPQ